MLSTVVALALLASPEGAEQPKKREEQETAKVEKKAETRKICRHIRMDMSSRRKERVCMTAEEWTAFNNGN
ncbi:hypothetical protein [Erythrobacter litoralis]|uniref:Uncharacterized protein n=1 Tax=Erythrobacter litoralis (strain HTCC2594) TaxID=314225 RepID=Q2NAS3_ERYLH|nr:hypothetical protein [Erythrobacter litoralis]ABC63218.1 hypothetical protein ELI_05630 [Erythrobacter litoralis HTCC2594]